MKTILLVEDDPQDVELIRAVLSELEMPHNLVVARDGVEAMDYLHGRIIASDQPLPVVIFLDLKMPRVDGLELLRQLKKDAHLKTVPVVALTSSRQERDIVTSYQVGVNAYVVKPISFNEFAQVLKQTSRFWLMTNQVATRSLAAK